MKKFNKTRAEVREIRHKRITRKHKIFGNILPRLVITKTNKNIFAQIFDDVNGKTLASANSVQLKLKSGNIAACKKVGQEIAKQALSIKITTVTFDRGGNKYHGRVKALAEAAKEAGLKF